VRISISLALERLENRADEELLLRALVQTLLDYSLCIRETEDGNVLLIFPSQYRRDRDIPEHPRNVCYSKEICDEEDDLSCAVIETVMTFFFC
jgi:hypothetical protein